MIWVVGIHVGKDNADTVPDLLAQQSTHCKQISQPLATLKHLLSLLLMQLCSLAI